MAVIPAQPHKTVKFFTLIKSPVKPVGVTASSNKPTIPFCIQFYLILNQLIYIHCISRKLDMKINT